MASKDATGLPLTVQLQQEFDREVDRLALAAERDGPVEGVFRLRALLELCEALPTTALLELAFVVAEGGSVRQIEQRLRSARP